MRPLEEIYAVAFMDFVCYPLHFYDITPKGREASHQYEPLAVINHQQGQEKAGNMLPRKTGSGKREAV